MIPIELDNRIGFGTDMGRSTYAPTPANLAGSAPARFYPTPRQVRVILAKFGPQIRLSAPELNIRAEGATREDAWARFLEVVRVREDSPWLIFDVGPTRREEISEGLNISEHEDWSGLLYDSED